MTDFVKQIRHQGTDLIIRSLMDVDFYKFTMGYYIFQHHRGTHVKFGLINRDKSIPLAEVIDEDELREQLDHVSTLRFRKTDLYYLRGMDVYGKNMFSEDYIEFLAGLQLPKVDLKRVGDQFELTFEGPWETVTFWETIALAIISELYYRTLMRSMNDNDITILYANAATKLYSKLNDIRGKLDNVKIADFGQRRRHSFLWQKFAIETAKNVLGSGFTGTSNTWLAFNQDMVPVGTNAHELPMVVTALYPDHEKKQAQYDIVSNWGNLFGPGLRIVLPDTYGSKQFFRDMPKPLVRDIVENWRGIRQDSGNPETEADDFYKWIDANGGNPKEKVCIFSDGLDAKSIIQLHRYYRTSLITPFGWGTMLTNDFVGCDPTGNPLFRPFSMVCKVQEAESKPAVKLSNNPMKATGDPTEVARYMEIFGTEGQVSGKVMV